MKELRIDIWAVWFSKWKSKTYQNLLGQQNHSGSHSNSLWIFCCFKACSSFCLVISTTWWAFAYSSPIISLNLGKGEPAAKGGKKNRP